MISTSASLSNTNNSLLLLFTAVAQPGVGKFIIQERETSTRFKMQLFFTVHEPIYPTCGQMPVRAGGGGGPGAGEEEGGGGVADHGVEIKV